MLTLWMEILLLLVVIGFVYRGYRKVRNGPSWPQLVAGLYGVWRELRSTDLTSNKK